MKFGKNIHVLGTDAFKDLSTNQDDLIILTITREEIERRTTRLYDLLRTLTDTPKRAWTHRERLCFIISGYDDDARELYEIPEVCTHFKQVTAQWPYWFHFLAHAPGINQHTLLMSILSGVIRVTQASGRICVLVKSTEDYAQQVDRLLHAVADLYQAHGWPVAKLDETIQKVMAVLAE
jgi:hypothetical protein